MCMYIYMCIYMYNYGIVKAETYSYNKRVISIKYSHIVSFLILANTQIKENPKTSIVYCGAPTFTHATPYP